MRRTLFMHIPKTAGTSVLAYMREVYSGQDRQELRWPDGTLGNVTRAQVQTAQFIWLHEPLCELQYDTSKFFRYTILRDPAERIWSHYRYMRDPRVTAAQSALDEPEYLRKALLKVQDMSFDEFVLSEDPGHVIHISNIYATYLRGDEKGEARLDDCLENLQKKFQYVGFADTLAEDVGHIKAACFPEYAEEFGDTRANASQMQNLDDSLSEKGAAALNEKISLDRAIYDFARKRREKILARGNGVFRTLFRKMFRR